MATLPSVSLKTIELQSSAEDLNLLMQQLRQQENSIRTWNNLIKTSRANLLEKRVVIDAADRHQFIQSLEVLRNNAQVHSAKQMVMQLEDIGLEFGFRSSSASDLGCVLKSLNIEAEFALEPNGRVTSVVFKHPGGATEQCVGLVSSLNNHNWSDLKRHLQGLHAMYSQQTISDKAKHLLVGWLDSFDAELRQLCSPCTSAVIVDDSTKFVLSSPLGLMAPRSGGMPSEILYCLAPYDLVDSNCEQMMSLQSCFESHVGSWATIHFAGLGSSGQPLFSVKLPNPQPVLIEFLDRMKAAGVHFDQSNKDEENLLSLLFGSSNFRKGSLVVLPGQQHRYVIDVNAHGHMKAASVNEFTVSTASQLVQVVHFLRLQVLYNALLSSCHRHFDRDISSTTSNWKFDVTCVSSTKLQILFEHPTEQGFILADVVLLAEPLSVKMMLKSVGSNIRIACSDKFCSKVLERSWSIPVTLRAMLIKTLGPDAFVSRVDSSAQSGPSHGGNNSGNTSERKSQAKDEWSLFKHVPDYTEESTSTHYGICNGAVDFTCNGVAFPFHSKFKLENLIHTLFDKRPEKAPSMLDLFKELEVWKELIPPRPVTHSVAFSAAGALHSQRLGMKHHAGSTLASQLAAPTRPRDLMPGGVWRGQQPPPLSPFASPEGLQLSPASNIFPPSRMPMHYQGAAPTQSSPFAMAQGAVQLPGFPASTAASAMAAPKLRHMSSTSDTFGDLDNLQSFMAEQSAEMPGQPGDHRAMPSPVVASGGPPNVYVVERKSSIDSAIDTVMNFVSVPGGTPAHRMVSPTQAAMSGYGAQVSHGGVTSQMQHTQTSAALQYSSAAGPCYGPSKSVDYEPMGGGYPERRYDGFDEFDFDKSEHNMMMEHGGDDLRQVQRSYSLAEFSEGYSQSTYSTRGSGTRGRRGTRKPSAPSGPPYDAFMQQQTEKAPRGGGQKRTRKASRGAAAVSFSTSALSAHEEAAEPAFYGTTVPDQVNVVSEHVAQQPPSYSHASAVTAPSHRHYPDEVVTPGLDVSRSTTQQGLEESDSSDAGNEAYSSSLGDAPEYQDTSTERERMLLPPTSHAADAVSLGGNLFENLASGGLGESQLPASLKGKRKGSLLEDVVGKLRAATVHQGGLEPELEASPAPKRARVEGCEDSNDSPSVAGADVSSGLKVVIKLGQVAKASVGLPGLSKGLKTAHRPPKVGVEAQRKVGAYSPPSQASLRSPERVKAERAKVKKLVQTTIERRQVAKQQKLSVERQESTGSIEDAGNTPFDAYREERKKKEQQKKEQQRKAEQQTDPTGAPKARAERPPSGGVPGMPKLQRMDERKTSLTLKVPPLQKEGGAVLSTPTPEKSVKFPGPVGVKFDTGTLKSFKIPKVADTVPDVAPNIQPQQREATTPTTPKDASRVPDSKYQFKPVEALSTQQSPSAKSIQQPSKPAPRQHTLPHSGTTTARGPSPIPLKNNRKVLLPDPVNRFPNSGSSSFRPQQPYQQPLYTEGAPVQHAAPQNLHKTPEKDAQKKVDAEAQSPEENLLIIDDNVRSPSQSGAADDQSAWTMDQDDDLMDEALLS